MSDLIAIKSKNNKIRIVLVGAMIFALAFGWFAIRWQLGSMMANLTAPDSVNASPLADLAFSLAPDDPVASWLRASVELNGTSPDHIDSAVKIFEEAVKLSPQDYRWRIELGRAYEQAEKTAQAENSFKRAIELAPTYAFPHWHLGNFYLRQNRIDEAFAELRMAAENNRDFREQVFSLAWDYFDKDPENVEQLAADNTDSRARLALFFAARGQAAEALRVWNLLSETDKAAIPQIAKPIALGLFSQRFYRQALEFSRQLGIDADARPETLTNGGFERLINNQDDSRFGWQVGRTDSKVDVSADGSVRHDGARSLKVSFRNYVKPELYAIFQTVVVEPNTNYRLNFWVRTENLKSMGGPLLEVINANDNLGIGSSKSFQTGTNDWEKYFVDFRTPANCSGITIRTARAFCGEQCPIAGVFWYDDFELSRR
ncbi:MAG: tetratricopeptide repeat protein [Pyrinomonadaceae bacterium]